MADSPATLSFPLLEPKPVQVSFSGGTLSSDGGVLLLAQLDQQLGLTARVAACLRDPRLPERITHPLLLLIRQRVYQIAAGYEDCLDANRLREDPALKIAVGRRPASEGPLASQSTLSRLEYTVSEAECAAINEALLAQFLRGSRRSPKEIVLDFDTSEDPTHGQQELALFNTHYGGTCYLPLFVFAKVAGESEEFLVSAELPDTHAKEADDLIATLARLVAGLRARWPLVKIVLRADAWFGTPDLYDWCEAHRVAYAIAIPANPVLHREGERWRQQAAVAAANSAPKQARRFGAFWYQAKGWPRARQVIVKVEVTPHTTSVRYVLVSELKGKPRLLYHFYGRRGGCENRIKELKAGVKSDRTSCMDFASNKVRLMLAAVAYVLFQGLRRLARHTGLSHAQVETLRIAVIKIAAQVKESQRRVTVALCSACPSQFLWLRLARRLGLAGV